MTGQIELETEFVIFTLRNRQKKEVAINLHSFTETNRFPVKEIKRDGEEFLDVLSGVETDHCDADTFPLVFVVLTQRAILIQSIHNEQLLVTESHSVSIVLLWELYLLYFTGNDLYMVILKKGQYFL